MTIKPLVAQNPIVQFVCIQKEMNKSTHFGRFARNNISTLIVLSVVSIGIHALNAMKIPELGRASRKKTTTKHGRESFFKPSHLV